MPESASVAHGGKDISRVFPARGREYESPRLHYARPSYQAYWLVGCGENPVLLRNHHRVRHHLPPGPNFIPFPAPR